MQNNFNISNTDIVTMLMVQKTNELQKELAEILASQSSILLEVQRKITKDAAKLESRIKPYLDACISLLTLYNPKAKFTLTCNVLDPEYGKFYRPTLDKDGWVLNIHNDYLPFILEIDEESQDKWNDIEPGNGFYAPIKFNKSYRLPEEYGKLLNRYHYINALLVNKEALKEQIIAKVTENALMQSSELKLLAEQVKLDI